MAHSSPGLTIYQLVDSTHDICMGQALNEWFTRETFANVVLMCKTTGGTEPHKLRANASVLAAVSPFFKKLLEKRTTFEQEMIILLPEYDQVAVFCALEYMYTGVINLSASGVQIAEVESLLKDFGLVVIINEIPEDVLLDKNLYSGDPGPYEVDDSIEIIEYPLETPLQLNDPPTKDSAEGRRETHCARAVETVKSNLYVDLTATLSSGPTIPRSMDTPIQCRRADADGGRETHCARAIETVKSILYMDPPMTCSSGPTTPRTVDAPIEYDPSPEYLLQVPTKQYTRKRNNPEPKPAAEKADSTVRQEKVHIASDGELRSVPPSSIFADPENGPSPDEQSDDKTSRQKSARSQARRRKPENVSCDVCGKVVKDRWIKYHKKTHEVHQHVCEKCGHSFAFVAQLNVHVRLQHSKQVHQYPCPHCNKVLKTSKALKHHVTLHTGERRYKCKYCDKCFRHSEGRKSHMRTHTGEKPNLCEFCGKCFNQMSTLTKHRKMHERMKSMDSFSANGRPYYKCDQCPRAFRCEISLLAHRAKHTGKAPDLPCSICSKVFSTFPDLRYHRLKNHALEKYFCKTCEKQFLSNTSFNKHMRDEHGKEKRQYGLRPLTIGAPSNTPETSNSTN